MLWKMSALKNQKPKKKSGGILSESFCIEYISHYDKIITYA